MNIFAKLLAFLSRPADSQPPTVTPLMPLIHSNTGTITLSAPLIVTGYLDCGWKRYTGHKSMGDSSQKEGQRPLFILRGPNAELRNLILGPNPCDGIHIETSSKAKLARIHFPRIGEDAITVHKTCKGDVLIQDCIFLNAEDKAIQVNSPADTLIKSCYFSNVTRCIRSNGTGPNLPFRITADSCTANRGVTFLKVTNSKGKGFIRNCHISNMDDYSGNVKRI